MNRLIAIGVLSAFGAISACSNSPDESTGTPASADAAGEVDSGARPAESAELPLEELIASFEMSGEAPYNVSTVEATLDCQSAKPGTPFRAQWVDKESGVSILVAGKPSFDQGPEHRVDTFQVARPDAPDARLRSATLRVEALSSSGDITFYAVEADGVFAEGGTFSAAGTCKA